ncbi:MAG: CHASE4 domain-containing protein, partial [bacterium]
MKSPKFISMRVKLFIFLCAVSLIPLLLTSHILFQLGGKIFRSQLDYHVRTGLDRSSFALSSAEARLLGGAQAVAKWDELGGFLQDDDVSWPERNLMNWVRQSYKLDYLAICDPTGRAIYQWDPLSLANNDLLAQFFHSTRYSRSGIVSVPRDLFMVASSDIYQGAHRVGILIFGRRLNHNFLLEVLPGKEQDLMVYYGNRLLATTDTTSTLPYTEPTEIFSQTKKRSDVYIYEAKAQKRVIGLMTLKNVQGLEVASLGWSSTETPARFVQEAVENLITYFGIPLLLLVLLFALVLGLWIERPIRLLSKTMEEISQTGDLAKRVTVGGGGEIASMSKTFNHMLEQLSRQRDELLTFRTMIITMNEGVLIEDNNYETVYMNPRMEEMLGMKFEKDPSKPLFLQLERKITTKGKTKTDELGFFIEEVEWTKPNEKRIQALKSSGVLKDPAGNAIGNLSTFIDVTEKNDLELELIEASRMAFLGIYSQGIIHNLNGPLNGILGFATLLYKENPDAEIPRRIRQESQRISEMIMALGRRWQRTGTHLHEPLNLNDIIVDEMSFLEADLFFKLNIEKVYELDRTIPSIHGIYGDFSHALLNILVNAIDAVRESDAHRITI